MAEPQVDLLQRGAVRMYRARSGSSKIVHRDLRQGLRVKDLADGVPMDRSRPRFRCPPQRRDLRRARPTFNGFTPSCSLHTSCRIRAESGVQKGRLGAYSVHPQRTVSARGDGEKPNDFSGGEGIRTPGTLASTPVFKTGSLGHSDTPPDPASRPRFSSTRSRDGLAFVDRRARDAWHRAARYPAPAASPARTLGASTARPIAAAQAQPALTRNASSTWLA